MTWQILIAITVLTGSLQNLLLRFLLKGKDSKPIVYLVVSQILAALFLVPLIFYFQVPIPNLTPFIPNLLLMMVLIGTSTVLWFRALKKMEASKFTVLWATRAFWSIIGAVFFLGESFSMIQVFGGLLIFSSIIILNWRKEKFKLGKTELMALLAAALFGLQFANDGYILRSVHPFLYIPLALVLISVANLVIVPKTVFEILPVLKGKNIRGMIALSVLTAITIATYLGSYTAGGNISQIATINQTQIIVTVVLAIILLKERGNIWKKIFASLVAFAGVILVS